MHDVDIVVHRPQQGPRLVDSASVTCRVGPNAMHNATLWTTSRSIEVIAYFLIEIRFSSARFSSTIDAASEDTQLSRDV
jgi:hypothetical protein